MGVAPGRAPGDRILDAPSLELDALLGLDALRLVGVLDHPHLGNEVGEVDQLLRGIPAGDDDVQRARALLERIDDLIDRDPSRSAWRR